MLYCFKGKIEIGQNVGIASGTCIYHHNHDIKASEQANFRTGEVTIGDNVWIGSNVVILKGMHIGENSVIGAGAIISGNINPNTLIVVQQEYSVFEIQ